MFYKTQHGDSPSLIARRFGVPFHSLISANPHKPTVVVRGRPTWNSLLRHETLRVPGRLGGTLGGAPTGTLGDSTLDAIDALIHAGGPCLQANVGFVCALQAALGVTVDGKYGTGTATAARKIFPGAPPGCSPTPAWWGAKGSNKCAGIAIPAIPASVIPASAIPVSMPSIPISVPGSVPAAVQALVGINPCLEVNAPIVCEGQRALGLTVDGKYGSGTAAAVQRLVPGAHPGCSPTPAWWGAKGTSKCGGALPVSFPQMANIPTNLPPVTQIPDLPPLEVSIPAQAQPVSTPVITPVANAPIAVRALASIDPCDPANVSLVCQAQAALGFKVGAGLDGKYGNDTANAARRFVPNAPAGCSPRPSWWTPTGSSNCPGAAPSPVAPSVPSTTTTSSMPTPTAPASPQTVITAPEEKKGLSTGAIAAGALGLAAVVGLIAVAVSKPPHGGTHGGAHGGGHKPHGGSRKSRPSHHGKSRKPRKK
jgi:hypothetical protein